MSKEDVSERLTVLEYKRCTSSAIKRVRLLLHNFRNRPILVIFAFFGTGYLDKIWNNEQGHSLQTFLSRLKTVYTLLYEK